MLSIENPEDREEYLREMLDPERSKSFFAELRSRETENAKKSKTPEVIGYKKSASHDAQGGARPKSGATPKVKQQVTSKNSYDSNKNLINN